VPGQETSIARRGPQGRTHFAGTRRTYGGTSQGAPWGPATPLGEVGWNGTRAILRPPPCLRNWKVSYPQRPTREEWWVKLPGWDCAPLASTAERWPAVRVRPFCFVADRSRTPVIESTLPYRWFDVPGTKKRERAKGPARVVSQFDGQARKNCTSGHCRPMHSPWRSICCSHNRFMLINGCWHRRVPADLDRSLQIGKNCPSRRASEKWGVIAKERRDWSNLKKAKLPRTPRRYADPSCSVWPV